MEIVARHAMAMMIMCSGASVRGLKSGTCRRSHDICRAGQLDLRWDRIARGAIAGLIAAGESAAAEAQRRLLAMEQAGGAQ